MVCFVPCHVLPCHTCAAATGNEDFVWLLSYLGRPTALHATASSILCGGCDADFCRLSFGAASTIAMARLWPATKHTLSGLFQFYQTSENLLV